MIDICCLEDKKDKLKEGFEKEELKIISEIIGLGEIYERLR